MRERAYGPSENLGIVPECTILHTVLALSLHIGVR
jgi:hypothetical protein